MEFTEERYIPELGSSESSYEHWHRYLYASQFVKDKVILDIACGEGYGSYLLAQTAKKVIGIDISSEVINHAASKYIRSNLEFKIGSVTNMPVEGEGIFDVTVSFETIEHVTEGEQKEFLKEVKRLLRRDGIFIVSTPNKLLSSDMPNYKNEFHIKEFYVQEFEEFLGKYFKNVILLGQKVYPISYVWNPDGKEAGLLEFRLSFSEKGFRPAEEPKAILCMIAVCSDREIQDPKTSVLIDLSERFLRWVTELEKGKAWLEEQWKVWQKVAEEREKMIQEQRAWIRELEQGKEWLDGQRQYWQAEAERRAVTIAKLERGQESIWGRLKAWLEQQWRSGGYG